MIELGAALLIFLIAFVFLEGVWPQNISRWNEENEFRTLFNRSVQLSSALVESPGVPSNWNTQSVEVIGLAGQKNVLDHNKLAMFEALVSDDYNLARHKMRFAEYDFFFILDSEDDSQDVNIGKLPMDPKKTVSIRRVVTMEGKNAILLLWAFR